jgi:DNA-binding GntR family transcriptional regulator
MTDPSPALARIHVRSAVDEVVDRLREGILTLDIAPGQHLRERELGAELGVSNIALREAFSRLAEEGLVVRLPRRGAFAAPVSAEIIRDLSDVRVVLEQHAVVRAIERWSDERDQEIEAIVSKMEAAAKDGDAEEMFQLDQQFHAGFLRAAESDTLVELATNLRGRIARSIRQAMIIHPEGLPELAIKHQRWLDAVRSGDRELARREVAAHITDASETIAAALETEAAAERDLDGITE